VSGADILLVCDRKRLLVSIGERLQQKNVILWQVAWKVLILLF